MKTNVKEGMVIFLEEAIRERRVEGERGEGFRAFERENELVKK